MAKGGGKKNKAAKRQHAMDEDWKSGPISEAAAGTSQEGQEGGAPAAAAAMDESEPGAQLHKVRSGGGLKQQVGRRGQRTSKQKARKRKSMERALGVAERKDSKNARQKQTEAGKKSLKSLWSKEPKQ